MQAANALKLVLKCVSRAISKSENQCRNSFKKLRSYNCLLKEWKTLKMSSKTKNQQIEDLKLFFALTVHKFYDIETYNFCAIYFAYSFERTFRIFATEMPNTRRGYAAIQRCNKCNIKNFTKVKPKNSQVLSWKLEKYSDARKYKDAHWRIESFISIDARSWWNMSYYCHFSGLQTMKG